jgi:S1-C subfamily serine protease
MKPRLVFRWLAAGALAGAPSHPVDAVEGRAQSATVFIRTVGKVTASYEGAWKETAQQQNVELGTGTGFLISPIGHVLTNHHVVSGEDLHLRLGDTDVQARVEVEHIEVVFSGGPNRGQRYRAFVDAADAELDLAVLSIGGVDLPFIDFGDSDALSAGQAVQVLGYPLGRQVEVGQSIEAATVPAVSVSRGSLAAVRDDGTERVRYLQTDAAVSPGSSGGPMLDEEDFAVGVMRMKLTGGQGLGFAIPINQTKDFLEAWGLGSLLRARRLRLGPLQSLEGKGLRIRLPEGWEDISPSRLRLDSGASTTEASLLRVDRVATPWQIDELELALTEGVFDGFAGAILGRSLTQIGERRAVEGRAVEEPGGALTPLAMEYAVVDLEKEKLVLRYLGPPFEVAFNRSVLRGSLRSLEADRLLTSEIDTVVPAELKAVDERQVPVPRLELPDQWVVDGMGPLECPDLPPPDAAFSASPPGDYTVSLRVAWWVRSELTPEAAARDCSNDDGAAPGTYSWAADWLGVPYRNQGLFLSLDSGLLRLELDTPAAKLPLMRQVWAAWRSHLDRRRAPPSR